MAKKLVLYNHKGGVGKTIITANLAFALAQSGEKVLIVDTDPQANVTAYFLEERVLDTYLDDSDEPNGRTMWSVVRPIVRGEGDIRLVEPIETGQNGLYLIPGDIRLSEFELKLTDYWRECFERTITGYRGTNAISQLINHIAQSLDIDYILYDAGPNIGPLNRVILLDCDYFIIPAASDLFSKRALNTLGITLNKWIKDWQVILSLSPRDVYMMKGLPKYLGFIPQRFKIYGGLISYPANNYIAQLERDIDEKVIPLLRGIDHNLAPETVSGTRIGEIRDYSTIVSLGQKQGVPIWSVTGGNSQQKTDAQEAFENLASTIIERTK